MAGGIRALGKHCCPIDLAEKHHLDQLGTRKSCQIIAQRLRKDDDNHWRLVLAARSLIYDQGYGVRSAEVERKLFHLSLIPTLVCQSFMPVAICAD